MKKICKCLIGASLAFALCTTAYAGINDGLVAYYPFNGSTNDESGNGNNDGRIVTGEISYAAGPMGQSAYLNGGTCLYLDNFYAPVGEGAISMWVKVDSAAEDPGVTFDSENNFRTPFHYNVEQNFFSIGGIKTPLEKDKWKLYTFVYWNGRSSSGTSQAYVDGVYLGTMTGYVNNAIIPWYYDPYDGSAIGGGLTGIPRFIGMIDEMRFYNRALSLAEVQELYNQGAPENTPPFADAGPDQAIIQVGSTVQLDGTQSWDPEGDTINYNWFIVSKPEGSAAELSDSTAPNPTFLADVHRDYTIELIVSDGSSSSTADQVIVTFNNTVPVANAGSNQSVVQGDQVCFDGNGSIDDNGDILSFDWSLIAPNGSTASLDDPSAEITCLTTDLPGTYEATLVVNDGWVDSPPSIASAYAASYQDETTMTLQETITTINDIPLGDLKNKNMQKTLTNKVNAALELIEQGAYAEALDKLQNDLLGKTDGCATSGSPDKNDWIEDCTSQGQIYPLIMEGIEYVTELSHDSTNNQYFQMLLTSARVGDILLFSQCNGDVAEPLNCSAIIPEFLGYGYFSHAAIITEINADSLTYLHAYPGAGIASVTVSSADLVAYTSIMLLTVPEVQDATAIAIVDYGYSSWDGTEYDSNFLPFNSKMYCSELAYEIYNEFGVSLNDASYYPLGLITPDNLLQSGATESVMAYSPVK